MVNPQLMLQSLVCFLSNSYFIGKGNSKINISRNAKNKMFTQYLTFIIMDNLYQIHLVNFMALSGCILPLLL